MLLSELKKGDKAIIIGFIGDSRQIVERGIRLNKEVCLISIAPFKGPILYKINEQFYALRKDEAEKIKIELLNVKM